MLQCLYFLSFMGAAVLTAAGRFSSNPCPTASDPIACGMQSIVIGPLPDICLDIGEEDSVCLQGLTCTEIAVAGIPSLYVPPTAYTLGLSELQASCSGGWLLGDSSGLLTGSLSDFYSNFGVSFLKEHEDAGEFAEEIVLKECNVSSISINIHFTGRDIATVKLLNKAAPRVESLLEGTIPALLCGPVAGDVVDALTAIVVNVVNPALLRIMNYGPSEPPLLSDSVNWHDTPLEMIHVLSNLLQTNSDSIQQCIATAAPALRSLKSDVSFPQIGKFLRTNEISIPVNATIWLSPNMSLFIESVSIGGLDSIQDLVILSPVEGSDVTLSSSLNIKSLNISVNAVVSIGPYSEAVVISVELKNSTLLLDLVFGVSQSGLNSLYLDQVVNIACLQRIVEILNITSLLIDVDLKQLQYIQVSGDAGPLEKDTVAIIQNFIILMINGFPELVHDTIIGLGQGPIRAAVNDLLADRVEADKTQVCPEHVEHDPETPNWIRWNSSVVIKTLDLFLDTVLGAEGLNSFFSCATGGTGVVKFTPRPEMMITLSGLTSFYDFSVLLPVVYEPYELYNNIGLGYCPPDEGAPCTPFQIDLKFNIEEDPGELAVSFQNVQIMLGLFLEVDLNEVYNLQFGDWAHEGCKMSTVDDLHLYDLKMSSAYSELFLMGGKNRNITTLVNKFFAKLTSAAHVANINSDLESYVDNSDYVCTETVNPNSIANEDGDSRVNKLSIWKILVIVGGATLTLIVLLYMHYHFSIKNEKSMWHVVLSDENILRAMYPEYFDKYRCDEALFFHKNIPFFWRMAMPVCTIGIMCVVYSSNVTTAVDVLLEIDIGTEVVKPPPIFSYGLGNTITDLWDAEVYALSALVAFFSGAWPYVKLFAMLLCWVLPPGLLCLPRREKVLEWLDILGKWSILDAYVMNLLMVAFHMTVNLEEPVTAIVTVLPKYGFYSFVAATMASLVMGHVAVIAHHKAVGNKRAREANEMTRSNSPTMNHDFVVPSRQSKISFTAIGKMLITFLILLTTFLILAGAYLKTFTVQIRGLVGYLIDLNDDPSTDYSLLDIGALLPVSSGQPDYFGVRWCQAAFYMFAFVMPMCLQASLLLLWLCPFSLKWQQRIFVLAEVFNAWSAIDVFSVSIVAVLLEIQDFASFIVGDSCDVLNDVLSEYFDEELHGDDKCFDVTAKILAESWTTYAAAFLLITVELPILLLCKRILEERLDLNGILIEKDSENGDGKVDNALLEPLIPESDKKENSENSDSVNDGNKVVHIGGSSGSDGSQEERNNEWLEGKVVVDDGMSPWDSSSGGSSTPAFNQKFIDDLSDVDKAVLCDDDSFAEKGPTVVSAHGINRTSGKGGSGSSGGSRGVLASVDLTDGPEEFIGSVACNSPPRKQIVKISKSTDVNTTAPLWNRSVSTSSFDGDDRSEVFSDRIINALLYIHVLREEPT